MRRGGRITGILCSTLAAAVLAGSQPLLADARVLHKGLVHLRSGDVREWSEFPEQAAGPRLAIEFQAEPNRGVQTLTLRQRDVKERWAVLFNGQRVALLTPDENDQITTIPIAAGALTSGLNQLVVEAQPSKPDDIWLGDIRLDSRPPEDAIGEATMKVQIVAAEDGHALPGRITIVDADGALAPLANHSDALHAVRPGVVYTADGSAQIRLPRGNYRVFAGRGFEYGVARAEVTVAAGEVISKRLAIAHEVDTRGLVSCDTHCHTFTYSRHGDATLAERLVTLAGEGIELPIATDHNLQIDYRPAAAEAGLTKWFTPVVGNEVTTRVGHFNVFPVLPGGSIDTDGRTWTEVFTAMNKAPAPVVFVLNHACDVHGGFRPFGPARHIELTGEELDGWELDANAMEVINSGALRSDPMELVRGWFGELNAGVGLAPVGSSDSHDVSRSIVGQGRTYIRADDSDPSRIDVAAACQNLAKGRASASLGLLAQIIVGDRDEAFDFVAGDKPMRVRVRVSGPSWTQVDHVGLYANGVLVREAQVDSQAASSPGVKFDREWVLERGRHDFLLAAVARGPGVREPFWPIAKPYQPSSPDWKPYVLAVAGAVLVDADGDGFSVPRRYAKNCWREAGGDVTKMLTLLKDYDEPTAAQGAAVLRAAGIGPFDQRVVEAMKAAAPSVRRAFSAYQAAWKASQLARDALPGDMP